MEYAQANNLDLQEFETFEQQAQILLRYMWSSRQAICRIDCSGPSTDNILDQTIVAWQLGDAQALKTILHTTASSSDGQSIDKEQVAGLQQLWHQRNVSWSSVILEYISQNQPRVTIMGNTIQETEPKPFFIACGAGHLFDIEKIKVEGLISLISKKYSVCRENF